MAVINLPYTIGEGDTTSNTKIEANFRALEAFISTMKYDGTQGAHIEDADGTLADVTAKFNALLLALETMGLLASS